jgi:TPR repeat protein
MSPPDHDPKAAEEDDEETDAVAEGDVDALLTLAKTRRAAKDLKGCYEAYKSAADLGSMEAEYAVALFVMNGSVVPQDLKEGTMRLRSAADKGSIPAKVYLGNLYELGIHYKADPEKADVWYRNAARAARIEEEPGSDEHAKALAELGCVRYVLARVESGAVDDNEKTRLLTRAKAHGYGLKAKDGATASEGSGERPTMTDALLVAETRERKDTAPETKQARVKIEEATKQRSADTTPPAAKKKTTAQATSRMSDGLAAFGYALLFAVAGVGAAYAATLGAQELAVHGTKLPGLGTRTELVFPIVLGVIGVLPAWLVYKFSAFAKGLVAAGVMGGVGWVAWGMGQVIHANRWLQAIVFGLSGFLAALLVLGILGGTKLKPKRPPPPVLTKS